MRDIFKQFDIELSDQQENKLKEYYKILVEENKKMNLTSITEYEDVVWKHFLDSALIMKDSLWNEKSEKSHPDYDRFRDGLGRLV